MAAEKRGIRVPIWAKIGLSCLVLSEAIVGVMYLQAKRAAMAGQDRGPFLQRMYERTQEYLKSQGGALEMVAQIVARQPEVRAALDSEAAPAPATGVGPMPVPGLGGSSDGAAGAAQARLQSALDLLGASMEGDSPVHPDLIIVVDRDGNASVPKGSPIAAADVAALVPAKNAREGAYFARELMLHNGILYMVAGVPVRAGDRLLGGVLIGSRFIRVLEDYSRQTDTRADMRQQFALLGKDGKLLLTTVKFERPEARAELTAALAPDKWVKVNEGKRYIPAIKFGGGLHDFTSPPPGVTAFDGQMTAEIGKLYLMRTRRAREAGIPGLWTITIAASVLALAISMLLAWIITRPIKRFIRATEDIIAEGGDLSRRVDMSGSDELADLARNLNKVFDNLHRLARDVSQASSQVGASSAEISAASKQMLEGVKDQAVKVESSTAAVTELSSSIQQVASNAMEATRAAQQTNTAVASAIGSMNQIRNVVEEGSEKIRDLGESSKRIGNIVEVIRQISEQTSLLALNASIEAAHAGEQGRGFAVVADEVSSLARRVGQSAKDIEDLIATIKEQTAAAVRTMQLGTQAVEAGTQTVTATLGNLKHIVDAVQDTANAVQEQALVSDEIARNMDHVQKIAQEVLSASEEAVVQGEQLHALAHNLEESVRGFRIEGDGGEAGVERDGDHDGPAAPRLPPRPTAKPRAMLSAGSTSVARTRVKPRSKPPAPAAPAPARREPDAGGDEVT